MTSETTRRHLPAPFPWRHIGKLMAGVLVLAVIYESIGIYLTYRREVGIARLIEADDGDVTFEFCGPSWIPQSLHGRFRYLHRISRISHNGFKSLIKDSRLAAMQRLTHLQSLSLFDTPVTGSGFGSLQSITSLRELRLNFSLVDDAGLEHLQGMTMLTEIDLSNTQTTVEGRAKLRQSLPGCRITPDP
jgi:hypothetical protein